jgi:hypothetical protein
MDCGGESGHQDPRGPYGRRGARSRRGGRAEGRSDTAPGRYGHDGLPAVREDGRGPRPGGSRRPVRRPQRHPTRLQEPRRPPLPAGLRRQIRHPLLPPGERHLPLLARRAIRQAWRDARRGGFPHDFLRSSRLHSDRGRRPRRGPRYGRTTLPDPRSQGRRRRADRGPLGLGDAERCDPRALEEAGCQGRSRAHLRVFTALGLRPWTSRDGPRSAT